MRQLLVAFLSIVTLTLLQGSFLQAQSFPEITLFNDEIKMKIYLPDSESGYYRGTRFEWSGIIGELTYKGHQYFGRWKQPHDPLRHDAVSGPSESSFQPGFGYDEATPGEGFLRLGVGTLIKEKEVKFNWMKTYSIQDHGLWDIRVSKSSVTFTHILNGDLGYAYVYEKTIKLEKGGFIIDHNLKNTGQKIIKTDHYNHNFFVLDNENTGPNFAIAFPWNINIDDYDSEYFSISRNKVGFNKLLNGRDIFLKIKGYKEKTKDNHFIIRNTKTGVGVISNTNAPIYEMSIWASESVISPEPSIWLEVLPSEEFSWKTRYDLIAAD